MEVPQGTYHTEAYNAPELSSWEILEALDAGVPDSFLLPENAKATSARERSKEKSRQAAKRARQRNKVPCAGLRVTLPDH